MSHHLITGGAGFIGSNLAHRLVREGHTVTVLDRMSRGKIERLPAGVEFIAGDIRDPKLVRRAMVNARTVWHLAYVQGTQTFYADPRDVIDVALTGTMNVLHACESVPWKPDLFLVSSSEVYQEPPAGMFPTDELVPLVVPNVTNPRYSYGAGKIAGEVAALAFSQAGVVDRAVIARPHNVYGPDMGNKHVIPEFANRMLDLMDRGEHEFHIQGTGRETRSFCFIDDCIDAFMVLLEHGEDRNVYHVGNPYEEHAIAGVASQIASWFGWAIEIVPGRLPKGSPVRRLPDIGKIARLGFDPSWTLREGLKPTLEWYAATAVGAA